MRFIHTVGDPEYPTTPMKEALQGQRKKSLSSIPFSDLTRQRSEGARKEETERRRGIFHESLNHICLGVHRPELKLAMAFYST